MEEKNKQAAQPQGEPVAPFYICIEDFNRLVRDDTAIASVRVSREKRGPFTEPLYAEQPAPVAVVHTMRSIMEAVERSSEYTVLTSNQCSALAVALNSARPTHANPPPGTEPSGTHPHNDGLDEMRKPKMCDCNQGRLRCRCKP